jgi:hypothetical protein
MFNLFKKSEEKTYKVMVTICSLCQCTEVATFKDEKAAHEYCYFKNTTTEDPDFEWSVIG